MKLTENVYAYIWNNPFENNCNMYYFGEPLNVLFDAGLQGYAAARAEELKQDAVAIEKTSYLVNTHSHPDHIGGCTYFADKTRIAMHKDEIDFCRMMGKNPPACEFNTSLEEGPWEVNGTELQIIHTPGHTPGSICIYWPEKKALVCGDLIFARSVGRTDLPGGNGEALKSSIEKIAELDIELLLPGHMSYIKERDNVKRNFDFIFKRFFPFI